MNEVSSSATVVAEPTGKAVGRVTMSATLAAIVPTLVAALVIVAAFAVGIIPAETASALLVGALVTGGLIAPSVFTAGKVTPTDQVRTVTRFEAVETAPSNGDVPPVELPEPPEAAYPEPFMLENRPDARHLAVDSQNDAQGGSSAASKFPGGGVVDAPLVADDFEVDTTDAVIGAPRG